MHRWEITGTAVYTQTGWWARERRIAPMSRIQTVDHAEGAIARLFGLATVTVTTASAAGALEIEGLDRGPGAGAGRRAHPDGRQRARGRHVTTQRRSEWQRLDPRMLLIYPVKEFVRFLPALIALFIAGSASGGTGEWWQLLGIVIPVGLGVLRYFTTGYRITAGRIELRRGLLNRHVLSTPLDRVRTVDITAPPDPPAARADQRPDRHRHDVRRRRGPDRPRRPPGRPGPARCAPTCCTSRPGRGRPTTPAPPEQPVLVFDPAWVRFAPLTSTGLVITAGVLGVASQMLNTFGGFERLHPERFADDAETWSVWVASRSRGRAGRGRSRRCRSAGTSSTTGASG